MTLGELRKLVPFWQERLNLGNWAITVTRNKNAFDVRPGRVFGYNEFSTEEETSLIYVKPVGEQEETLVHELLHLVFDDHKPAATEYDALHERALNRTAKALVSLANAARQ